MNDATAFTLMLKVLDTCTTINEVAAIWRGHQLLIKQRPPHETAALILKKDAMKDKFSNGEAHA
jgi:hypothetical protein